MKFTNDKDEWNNSELLNIEDYAEFKEKMLLHFNKLKFGFLDKEFYKEIVHLLFEKNRRFCFFGWDEFNISTIMLIDDFYFLDKNSKLENYVIEIQAINNKILAYSEIEENYRLKNEKLIKLYPEFIYLINHLS